MMEAIRRRRASDERGFTLVEMLVVIAILGILAAVAVFALGNTADESKRAACETDTQTVQAAADAHAAANNGTYPLDVAELVSEDYLRSAPSDPDYTPFAINPTDGAVSPSVTCASLSS